ncbi:MAG: hypothetical protein JKY89_12145 [Immundisolibacteraceae bacterium]|nr:hypothetical protein [Immundisolibacteraceae bacterium]
MRRLFCLVLAVMFVLPDQAALAAPLPPEIVQALTDYGNNNESSAIRRLQVMAEEDPNDYHARWLLLRFTALDLDNQDASQLGSIDEEVRAVIQMAIDDGNPEYAHYIKSNYARNHRAYEIAISEIDSAIEIDPDSVFFHWVKATLLVRVGGWKKDNELILEGIEIYKKAHLLGGDAHPAYYTEVDYHFNTAYALGRLINGKNCPSTAIDHYLAVAELSEEQNTTVAYAWNNVSCAYRKAGLCAEAKAASENALEIMDFGAARRSLEYSELCLQMQKIGLWDEAG